MRSHVPCTALVLAFVAASPAAHAQALISSQPVVTVVAQPVRTVRTVTTVRTLRPLRRRRVVVTRRTYVTDRLVRAATAPAVTAEYPAPLYDDVTPAPVAMAPYDREPRYDTYRESRYDTYREPLYDTYREPLYDTVVTTPAPVAPPPVEVRAAAVPVGPAAVGTGVPFYRYVYQPDRILVIDPNSGVAVQALPR